MKISSKNPLLFTGVIPLVLSVILLMVFSDLLLAREPFLHLSIDGPDPDNDYSLDELIRFGELDHLGTTRLRGDFLSIQSRPLGNADFFNVDFKGVIYEFSPLTGGNNEFFHPNAALAVKIKSPANWQLSIFAYVEGDPTVGVDQLMVKEDNQKQYSPFTPSPQVISRGNPGTYHLFYDLALRIDRNDRPGKYIWRITYMIINY